MLLLPKMTRNEFTRLTDRRTILTSRTPNPVRPVRRDVRFSRDRTFGFWILCPWMESCSPGPERGRPARWCKNECSEIHEKRFKKKEKKEKISKKEKKRKEKKRGGRKEVEETKERKVYHVCVYACVYVWVSVQPIITGLYRCFARISLLARPPRRLHRMPRSSVSPIRILIPSITPQSIRF